MNLPLPGGWHLRLPGYFHEDYALPEETVRFWFGDRQVSVTAIASPRPGAARQSLEAILRELDPPEDAGATRPSAPSASPRSPPTPATKVRVVERPCASSPRTKEDPRSLPHHRLADKADHDWAREDPCGVAYDVPGMPNDPSHRDPEHGRAVAGVVPSGA